MSRWKVAGTWKVADALSAPDVLALEGGFLRDDSHKDSPADAVDSHLSP